MEHQTFSAYTFKANMSQGIVESIVAVMGNDDQGDDVIHNGAFLKTITERRGKIRVLDQHQTDSILRVIGKPLDMREMSRDQLPAELLLKYPMATGGLYTKTQYLINTPEGKGAFDRIAAGAVDEYSIGYDALDVDYSKIKSGDGSEKTIRNLRTIKLYEYSPVIWGANSATQTLSAKSSKDAKPWNVFHEGDKWNVYKLDADGNQTGDALGTFDTEAEARAHLRALYANEGKSLKSVDLTTYVEEVTEAFNEQYGMSGEMNAAPMSECFCIYRVYDDHVIVWELMSADYYSVDYTVVNGEYQFVTQDTWVEGTLEFVPDLTDTGEMKLRGTKSAVDVMSATQAFRLKSGRILAARNETRLRDALKLITEALSELDKTDMTDEAPAKRAANPEASAQAGPTTTSPTEYTLMQSIDIELAELKLMEV